MLELIATGDRKLIVLAEEARLEKDLPDDIAISHSTRATPTFLFRTFVAP